MFYAFNPKKTVIKLAQFRGAISLKILQEFEILQNIHQFSSKTSSYRKWKSYKRASCIYG